MNYVWLPINIIQGLIILVWTAACGLLGCALRLVGVPSSAIILLLSRVVWGPFICTVSGVRVTLLGKEHIRLKHPAIYVANHASLYDIVALARVFPVALFFIAKIELKKVPFLGQYMMLIGHIFVDRKNKERSLASMQAAALKIKSGKNVISFPEGTRSKTGELLLFKRGAFMIAKEGNVPIVPVAITGAFDVLPSGRFSLRPGKIRVKVGKAIEPEEFEGKTVEEMASMARERVASLLERP